MEKDSDNSSGLIKWSGYNWITQERWGDIHPDKTYNWYDPSAVEIKDENLILKTHYNPKEFTVNNKKLQVVMALDWFLIQLNLDMVTLK